MNELSGKVAIVTGGASGMGAATAGLFASRGAKLVLGDLNEDLGLGQVQRILDRGGEAAFVKVDVTCAAEVQALVSHAVERYGRFDIAVNNAARGPDTQPIAEMREPEFDAVLAVNLKGVALCLKYEIGQMIAQGTGGSIINISSVSGIRPQPASPAYIAAKHGVIGLTKSAARDYSALGIRVNTIAPGAVDTPMLRGAMERSGRDLEATGKLLSMLGRAGSPDEVAQASLWLASSASSFVTGALLAVDGGYAAM